MQYIKKLNTNSIIIAALIVLIFMPRLYNLKATTIYPDEIIWMGRSREIFYAILKGNFDYFEHAWWFFTHATVAIDIPLLLLISPFQQILGVNPSAYSLQIMPEIVAARLPHAVFMGIFLLLFYFFAKKFTNKYVAFIGATLLALDPVFLQASRIVLQDAMLTAFCFLAIAAYFLIKNQKLSIFLTSLLAALAFLAKPTGLMVFVTFALWALLTKNKNELKKVVITGALTYVWIFILWPYLWKDPFFIVTYLWNQATISTLGTDNFYFGQITKSPSMTYYLFQVIVRLPAIITIIFITSTRHLARISKKSLSILLFSVTYFTLMSVMDKKAGARYILPIWPWIYLASAYSFWQLIKNQKQMVKICASGILILYQLTVAVAYFPDYYMFYNSFVGGTKNVHKYDLPNICYGTREAVEYIDHCFSGINSVAILGSSKTVAPYYSDLTITTDWKHEKLIILEHAHKTLLPGDPDILEVQKLPLVKKFDVKGAPIAYIYTNDPNIKNYCE